MLFAVSPLVSEGGNSASRFYELHIEATAILGACTASRHSDETN
jgi:hypothetical protein